MTAPDISPTSSGDPMLALLDQERAAFLAQVERVPPERRAERPAPDRWSVAEIIEHVARIDTGVSKLIALRSAEPSLVPPEQAVAARMTPKRAAWVRDRSLRIEAPERVRPTGTLTLEAALAQLASARAALKAAYQGAEAAVLDNSVHPHPHPAIGRVTLRGWVELAAHHDARHAQQIAELADAWAGAPV
jgi:hypothetical protein